MKRIATALAVSLGIAGFQGQTMLTAQSGTNTLTVTIKGVAPGLSLSLAMNGGKIGTAATNGTANSTGALDMVLNVANKGKIHTQVEVYVSDCSTTPPTTKVYLVEAGEKAPDDNCNRRKIGAFWLDKTRHITIQSGKLSAGGSSRTTWILVGGGGAAAAIVAVAVSGDGKSSTGGASTPSTPSTPSTGGGTGGGGTGGGGTSTTIVTNGTYTVVFTVSSDPNGHAPFVLYQLITQLIASGSGATATLTGNGPWQTVTAAVSNGVLTFDGTGTVAGRSNVRIRGTLTVTATGAISGTVTLGEPPNGSSTPGLPNGPITYTVSGQRAG